MNDTMTHDELEGQAALYALGALDMEEARDFESHLAEGCDACAAELREFERVVESLALAAPPAAPPAGVRARLLTLVASDERGGGPNLAVPQTEAESQTNAVESKSKRDARGYLVVRADEGEWVETDDAGVSYKLLFADRERGTYTTLVRMQPGARIPAHRHLGVEQCLVLEGDLSSGPVKMSAGDFNCSFPDSIHDEIKTDGGALLLFVSPAQYEVVEQHT
jgi:anti-sigma factor ChrR (cupin superfamily)